MNKVCSLEHIRHLCHDGTTIMMGGFFGAGCPERLIDALIAWRVKDLTLIANDHATPEKSTGKLIMAGLVKKAIASHIGTNPETGRRMNSGEMQVTLVPQGTLVERIRAGGAGLGGILTPTGIGTPVEEGKIKLTVEGRHYLLETPLRAEIALIKAHRSDRTGNLVYRRAARNFNPVMALAADIVIAEAEQIVEIGDIDPDEVMTPGLLVDYVIDSREG